MLCVSLGRACPNGQCLMREGTCCDVSCVPEAGRPGGAVGAATGEADEDCPDVNLDGVINVNVRRHAARDRALLKT